MPDEFFYSPDYEGGASPVEDDPAHYGSMGLFAEEELPPKEGEDFPLDELRAYTGPVYPTSAEDYAD